VIFDEALKESRFVWRRLSLTLAHRHPHWTELELLGAQSAVVINLVDGDSTLDIDRFPLFPSSIFHPLHMFEHISSLITIFL
jgi:hypothetical protein